MKCTFAADPQRELTEPEAIRRAQHGDAVAFEYLYRRHSKRVYSICLRMLKNTSDAEDVTRQIFLRVFREIGTFRGDPAFSTWLYRVTVNAVLMHLRRKKLTGVSPNDPDCPGQRDEASREVGPSETSTPGAIDWRNLLRAIRYVPYGYNGFSCFMTVGTGTAKLLSSSVARYPARNRKYTGLVTALHQSQP